MRPLLLLVVCTAGAVVWWPFAENPSVRESRALSPNPQTPPEDPAAQSASVDGEREGSSCPAPRRYSANDAEAAPTAGNPAASRPHGHVKRQWIARLEPSLAELAQAWKRGDLEGGFTMPLFDGEEAVIRVRRFDSAGAGRGAFRGWVDGDPSSMAVLAFVGSAESGTIQLSARGEVYEIRSADNGAIRMREIDVHAIGECAVCTGLASAPAATPGQTRQP